MHGLRNVGQHGWRYAYSACWRHVVCDAQSYWCSTLSGDCQVLTVLIRHQCVLRCQLPCQSFIARTRRHRAERNVKHTKDQQLSTSATTKDKERKVQRFNVRFNSWLYPLCWRTVHNALWTGSSEQWMRQRVFSAIPVGGHLCPVFCVIGFIGCVCPSTLSTRSVFWFSRPSMAWLRIIWVSSADQTPKTLLVLDFALQHAAISKFHAARRTL